VRSALRLSLHLTSTRTRLMWSGVSQGHAGRRTYSRTSILWMLLLSPWLPLCHVLLHHLFLHLHCGSLRHLRQASLPDNKQLLHIQQSLSLQHHRQASHLDSQQLLHIQQSLSLQHHRQTSLPDSQQLLHIQQPLSLQHHRQTSLPDSTTPRTAQNLCSRSMVM